jgi:hypothetical protein
MGHAVFIRSIYDVPDSDLTTPRELRTSPFDGPNSNYSSYTIQFLFPAAFTIEGEKESWELRDIS